ncbi:7602_t:CDS:1, partial [Paraglomus brasilianum]
RSIDNELDHQRIPTDEEIIEMVKHPDEPDGPEEPEEQFFIVKSGEAVHGVDVITNYIRQQNQ